MDTSWSLFGKSISSPRMSGQEARLISPTSSSLTTLLATLKTTEDTSILIPSLNQLHCCLQCSSPSISLESVLPSVLQLLATSNVEVKRMCINILRMADKDTALLALNLLQKDLRHGRGHAPWLINDMKDANPELRINAVNALCTLEALVPIHAIDAIHVALRDSQPSVRKAGVTGCGKIFRTHQHLVKENNLIDLLYNQIRDADPTVMTFTVQTLNFILTSEGGIVLNRKIAKHLMQRFGTLKEPELCFLLDTFATQLRIGEDDETREALLNVLHVYIDDKREKITAPPLFLSAAKLFKKVVEDQALERTETLESFQLMADFVSQITPRVQRLLRSRQSKKHNKAFTISLLDFMASFNGTIVTRIPSLMSDLQPSSRDDKDIVMKKLSVLNQLVCCPSHKNEEQENLLEMRQGNFKLVWSHFVADDCDDRHHLWQLLLHLSKCETQLHQCLISQVFKAVLLKSNEQLMLTVLVNLDKLFKDHRSLDMDKHEFEEVIDIMIMHVFQMGYVEADVLQCLLWVMGHFPKLLANAPYYLEHLVFELNIGMSAELIFVAVKVFVVYPVETQHTLAQVLADAKASKDVSIVDRANFYEQNLQDQPFVDHFRDFES